LDNVTPEQAGEAGRDAARAPIVLFSHFLEAFRYKIECYMPITPMTKAVFHEVPAGTEYSASECLVTDKPDLPMRPAFNFLVSGVPDVWVGPYPTGIVSPTHLPTSGLAAARQAVMEALSDKSARRVVGVTPELHYFDAVDALLRSIYMCTATGALTRCLYFGLVKCGVDGGGSTTEEICAAAFKESQKWLVQEAASEGRTFRNSVNPHILVVSGSLKDVATSFFRENFEDGIVLPEGGLRSALARRNQVFSLFKFSP
jgi:hypothetical protein